MDIADWLRRLGLERYEQAFRDDAVDGEVLAGLTAEDLKDRPRSRGRTPSQAARLRDERVGLVEPGDLGGFVGGHPVSLRGVPLLALHVEPCRIEPAGVVRGSLAGVEPHPMEVRDRHRPAAPLERSAGEILLARMRGEEPLGGRARDVGFEVVRRGSA